MTNRTIIGIIVLILLVIGIGGIAKKRGGFREMLAGRISTTKLQSYDTVVANEVKNNIIAGSQKLSIDCTGNNPSCPKIVIQGDGDATLPSGSLSNFRGFADPTLRKDPVSGKLWMAYSWPNIHVTGSSRVAGVDIHLAYSTDSGKTWIYSKNLWPSTEDIDKGGSGEAGFTDHEVANILPVSNGGSVTWYGVRLDYFLPANGGYGKRPPSSFQIKITSASSPEGLSTSPVAVLGSRVTAKGWGVDTYLSSLSSDAGKCGLWNEPSLYYEGGTLYLMLRCLAFNGRTSDLANSDMMIFSTVPSGDVKSWKWSYVGKIAGGKEAAELGGVGLTQGDIVKGVDGKLLLIATPDEWSPTENDYIHYGCRAIEIASINPPSLARDSKGKLIVRASVTATDQGPIGPGACTYDPSSETGIIMVRRTKTKGAMSTTINATGLKP